MLFFVLLIQFALLGLSAASVTQTCVWKNGAVAEGFLPCGNSTVSTGSCCSTGEACLSSGLCYGVLGLIYRGACLNTWGEGDCPTYCDGISDYFTNIFPCAVPNTGSADTPQNFWCGPQDTTICTPNTNSTFITILPGVATKLLIASSTSASTITASTASSTGNGNNTQSSNSGSASHSNNVTAIGLGVGLGVIVLALIGVGAWAYRSHRKQKQQFERLNDSMMQNRTGLQSPAQAKPEDNNYLDYGIHGELDSSAPLPLELDTGRA